MKISLLLLLSCFFSVALWADEPPVAEIDAEQQAYLEWAQKTWDALDRQTGVIEIPQAHATLTVPDSFYYLGPKDAEVVLSEIWGNPPGEMTLGMLMPADTTPFEDNSWAVTIEYEEDGYVSDKDAHKINYDDLLKQMKKDVAAASRERIKQGYESIELLDWAAEPYYDAAAHKLHWAKELHFGSQDGNTLNYNIRVLGRKGVLVLNFIAGIEQQSIIQDNLNDVLAMAEFNDGSTYADFNPSMDKVAAYGLGALITGKVLAKTGMFAAALLFLKKFAVVIIAGLAGLFKMVFSRKNN